MNLKLNSPSLRSLLGAGLLVGTMATASANTILTFNVDMSSAPSFDPATQTVSANGTFNGWGAFALTNDPTGPNPTVWSGTTNIPDNGIVLQYKYVIQPGSTYEGIFMAGSHNRLASLPSASGASLVLPLVYFGDAGPAVTSAVTFRVNMAQQINIGAFVPGTSSLQARGIFNGWAHDFDMTNDPSIHTTNQFGLINTDVYVYSYDLTGSRGQTMDFKYFFDPGANWESPAPGTGDPQDNNNRFFSLPNGVATALPIVDFNDSPYAPKATNFVTFQVDMSSQITLAAFTNGIGDIQLRGNFTSWGDFPITCTNDPGAANPNIYKAVVRLVDGVGATEQYKFFCTSIANNGGWETMADNRTMRIVDGTEQTLPVVMFNNQYVDPADVLPIDTLVTFQVSMTNAVGTDSHVFNPASDNVVINGIPSFGPWDTAPVMTNNPIPSKIYSIDLLIPRGTYLKQTYKYGMDGLDNEAPTNSNHIRYIRSTGTYVMPLDVFGHQNVESEFGSLQIAPATAGHVNITWQGLPSVYLQTAASLGGGSWTDHLETAGMSSTNWPTSSAAQFFRLVKP